VLSRRHLPQRLFFAPTHTHAGLFLGGRASVGAGAAPRSPRSEAVARPPAAAPLTQPPPPPPHTHTHARPGGDPDRAPFRAAAPPQPRVFHPYSNDPSKPNRAKSKRSLEPKRGRPLAAGPRLFFFSRGDGRGAGAARLQITATNMDAASSRPVGAQIITSPQKLFAHIQQPRQGARPPRSNKKNERTPPLQLLDRPFISHPPRPLTMAKHVLITGAAGTRRLTGSEVVGRSKERGGRDARAPRRAAGEEGPPLLRAPFRAARTRVLPAEEGPPRPGRRSLPPPSVSPSRAPCPLPPPPAPRAAPHAPAAKISVIAHMAHKRSNNQIPKQTPNAKRQTLNERRQTKNKRQKTNAKKHPPSSSLPPRSYLHRPDRLRPLPHGRRGTHAGPGPARRAAPARHRPGRQGARGRAHGAAGRGLPAARG